MPSNRADRPGRTPSQQRTPGKAERRSIVLSSVIIVGLIIALAGVVFAALGIGHVGVIDGEAEGVKLKTTSLGVFMILTGALLAGFVATNLPEGYVIHGDTPETKAQKVLRLLTSRGVKPYLVLCAFGVLLLLISILLTG
ncbi:hypothetical protein [Streptomyces sp. NPDC050856]|uniref:hypothetical protein n=1 Tax=Streptomyces sp. NPDC050856 TaxID=3154939 RepID=UPI0033EB2EE9